MLHNDTNRDVAAVQFYGIGIGSIVADRTGERMAGVIAWGQWRGYSCIDQRRRYYYVPIFRLKTLQDIPASISGGRGSGANPNLLNQFLSNGTTDNAIVSYNAEWNAGSGGYACCMNGTSFAVTDITHWLPNGTGTCFAGKAPSVQFPISSFQVFRGNRRRAFG